MDSQVLVPPCGGGLARPMRRGGGHQPGCRPGFQACARPRTEDRFLRKKPREAASVSCYCLSGFFWVRRRSVLALLFSERDDLAPVSPSRFRGFHGLAAASVRGDYCFLMVLSPARAGGHRGIHWIRFRGGSSCIHGRGAGVCGRRSAAVEILLRVTRDVNVSVRLVATSRLPGRRRRDSPSCGVLVDQGSLTPRRARASRRPAPLVAAIPRARAPCTPARR